MDDKQWAAGRPGHLPFSGRNRMAGLLSVPECSPLSRGIKRKREKCLEKVQPVLWAASQAPPVGRSLPSWSASTCHFCRKSMADGHNMWCDKRSCNFTSVAESKIMPWHVSQINNDNIKSSWHLLIAKPFPCRFSEVGAVITSVHRGEAWGWWGRWGEGVEEFAHRHISCKWWNKDSIPGNQNPASMFLIAVTIE